VSSDLFGDPCPGTHKYVEIHYTCSTAAEESGHQQQRPPWYVQPAFNGSAVPPLPHPWLKDVLRPDLPQSKNSGGAAPRIPILVATTTSTPKRIPITTPPPPTTTTTTLQSTSVAAAAAATSSSKTTSTDRNFRGSNSSSGATEDPNDPEDRTGDLSNAEKNLDSSEVQEEEKDAEEEEEGRLAEGSLVDMREQELDTEDGEFCRPSLARNLYWQQTRRGQTLVQPCPNGATGLARWLCSQQEVSIQRIPARAS
jgi:latrophilin 1